MLAGNALYQECGDMGDFEVRDAAMPWYILRFYYIRLSDLKKFVPMSPKRLDVYTHVLHIDDDFDAYFGLVIRTSMIWLDIQRDYRINVPFKAPELELDFDSVKVNGPPADLEFMKQSFECAKTLWNSGEKDKAWSAITLLYYVMTNQPANKEQAALLKDVRNFRASLTFPPK